MIQADDQLGLLDMSVAEKCFKIGIAEDLKKKGYGSLSLVAKMKIKKGQVIGEYKGQRFDFHSEEGQRRWEENEGFVVHVLDAYTKAEYLLDASSLASRCIMGVHLANSPEDREDVYANCILNAYMTERRSNKRSNPENFKLMLEATEDIEEGDEIAYVYNTDKGGYKFKKYKKRSSK